MSDQVDRFIKDHKEYFLRNRSIIENNQWNNTEYYKEKITSFSEQILNIQKSKEKDKEKHIKEVEKSIKLFLETSSKNKKALFEQENKLTTSILGRLTDFISEFSNDRNLPKTQKFIDFTVDIIKIHLKKTSDYLKYNTDVLKKEVLTEDEIQYNDIEIVFQDEVFNKKIDIQNKLSKLNITNSIENAQLKLYKDQKASLLMAEPLCLRNDDVKLIKNSLNITWDSFKSTELLKNMNPKNIPTWNHKKHFFEQDRDNLQFWQEEYLKITQGITINGYWIHPWLYWHLNIFKTPIPQPDGTEPTINPYLRDNELFFCENLIRAELAKNKGLLFYGTRRFTKALRDDQILHYTDNTLRPIGDSKVGDEIYGSDGKPTKILAVSPQGEVDIYKIVLSDGRISFCCEDHLWTVFDYQAKEYKVLPLKEIFKKYKYNRFRQYNNEIKEQTLYNYYLPINKPVEYNKTNLPIDPYYLGLWLGDGTSRSTSITTIDAEIKSYLKNFSEKEGLIYSEYYKDNTETTTINLTKKKGEKNNLLNKLKNIEVINNKHIPNIYLKSSIEDRMELLRGIMDTDGTISKSGGGIKIALASEILAKNILELCRSLGIACNYKYNKGTYIKKSGDFNDVYTVVLFTNKPIFKLSRKLNRIDKKPAPSRLSKMERVAIVSIEKNEKAKATCIRVDNNNKEFITNDFIVTHNSVILASYSQWKSFTKFNSVATITGGSEGDLTDLTSKIKSSMVYMPPAFKLEFIKQEWDGGDTTLGLREDASNPILYSTIRVKNLSAGAKTSSQKLAGGAPSAFVNDEIGKYNFLKSYLAALPSFETPFGFKCVPLLAGTAGESSLSDDAMKVLSDPNKFNLISMDWDTLNNWVDPEYITWKPRVFSLFVPAQMAYKEGFVKIDKKLGNFLKIKDADELNKNIIQVTDWKGNLEKIKAWRKEAEGDSLLLQQRTVQYPISPEECFINNEISPFSAVYDKALEHRDYLLQTGKWDRRRELVKNSQGKIESRISTKPLVEFPFSSENQEAPYLLIEDIPDFKPPKYMYVASADFYKQEKTTSTNSVCTVGIYKYDLFGDPNSKRLVASYAARPKTYRQLNDSVLLLLEAYNAIMLPENEDLGVFQTFLENKRLEEQYLEKHIDFNSALTYSTNDARKWGYTPKQSKRKLISMYANYLDEDVVIKNEFDEDISVKRVQTIDDIWLLSEILSYSESGNYDRISGHIGAIGLLHFLEKNYIYPKGILRKKEADEKPKEKKQKSFYTQRKRGGFYSNR